MVPQLGAGPDSPFPGADTALAHPDGLLAWGGDLEPLRLINAYRQGIFPWYSGDQPILWWHPGQRCVLYPAEVHVSRRLARVLRQGRFSVSADRAFSEVVAGCAVPHPGRESTWITPAMARAYQRMHQLGYGHSVEVWSDGALAGGIYGLSFGRMFFGESMFSRVTDASKVALVLLCRQLQAWNFALLDCQISNPHLLSMGAVNISRARFLALLGEHAGPPDRRGPWAGDFSPEA
jgi:leucyl/phenylalanyl-tRNA--protein transferase